MKQHGTGTMIVLLVYSLYVFPVAFATSIRVLRERVECLSTLYKISITLDLVVDRALNSTKVSHLIRIQNHGNKFAIELHDKDVAIKYYISNIFH